MERRRAAVVALVLALASFGAWIALRPSPSESDGDEMPAGLSSDAAGAPRALAGHAGPARVRPDAKPAAVALVEPARSTAKAPRRPIAANSIRGVVATDEGAPIADAAVTLFATENGVEVATLDVGECDENGGFSIASPAIAASDATAVEVSAPGRAPMRLPVVAGQLLVVRLASGGRVRGRVLAADTRAPIADVRVTLYRKSGPDGAVVESAGEPRTYTDAEGQFRAYAPAGIAMVSAYGLGYSSQDEYVEVRADAEAETTILLPPMGGRATLHGVVRVDGKPAERAVVSCASPSFSTRAILPGWAWTRSDAEGRYRLANVPLFQKIWVDAGPEHRGFVWLAEHDDRVTDWPLDIDAPTTEAVLGVVTQDGRPLAGVRFTMTCATHGQSRDTSDGEGRFRLTLPCPEGRGNVEARTPDGLAFRVPRVPRPTREDPTPSFSVAVPPFGRVRGRVTDREGQPIVGARVTADRSEVRSNESGAFEIAVRAGPDTRLRADAAGYSWQQTAPFDLAAGAVVERDVRLSPGGYVHGRVVDEGRKPIEGAVVRVVGGEGIRGETIVRTAKDGRFAATDATGDVFGVEVRAAGFRARLVYDVEPDSVLPDVVLERDASTAGKPPISGADDAKPIESGESPAPDVVGAKPVGR